MLSRLVATVVALVALLLVPSAIYAQDPGADATAPATVETTVGSPPPTVAVATPAVPQATIAISFTLSREHKEGRAQDVPQGSEFVLLNKSREICASAAADTTALASDQTVTVSPRPIEGVSCGAPDDVVEPQLLFPAGPSVDSAVNIRPGVAFPSVTVAELSESKVIDLVIHAPVATPGSATGGAGSAPASGLPAAGGASSEKAIPTVSARTVPD